MKIAHYIGDHAGDTLMVRTGWALTRMVQRGDYRAVTHTEAILGERTDGSVVIASATMRREGADGRNGVRIKHGVHLNPAHWLIADVPLWSEASSAQWFAKNNGKPYDLRGAWATVLPGRADDSRSFCTRAVGDSVGLLCARIFGPAQFAAITFTLGRDVTAEFFRERQVAHA